MSEHPTVDADDMADDIATLTMLREQKDAIAAAEKVVTERIKHRLEQADAEDLRVNGDVAVTWRHTSSKRLDQAKLKENYPEAVAACQSTTTTRRFVVTAKTND
ncbi:MAG: hypothetical protein WC054_02260 [Candidatus Nanopelagicales bacterium]